MNLPSALLFSALGIYLNISKLLLFIESLRDNRLNFWNEQDETNYSIILQQLSHYRFI